MVSEQLRTRLTALIWWAVDITSSAVTSEGLPLLLLLGTAAAVIGYWYACVRQLLQRLLGMH
jgi:hypothetical protein